MHEYMLIEEAAAFARTSSSTIRHWIRTGRLASVRPGRRRLVRRADLETFLSGAPVRERTKHDEHREGAA